MPANKAYFRDCRVTNISKSFTYKMAAKNGWHRYGTKLRHCHSMLSLRSASTEQLDVPTCRRSTIGGRAFPVTGASVWNGLPSDVTSASSLSVFKNRLKTYLFRRRYETV